MVVILFTELTNRIDDDIFNVLLTMVPASFEEQILRYKRWQDRQTSLFGKLLLLRSLREVDVFPGNVFPLHYTDYRRPFFSKNTEIDFNISHTHNCVVCALSKEHRVGIDVEEVVSIDITEFRAQFHEQEWNLIECSTDRCYQFYNSWTRKEAVIKADGRGLSIPLKKLSVIPDQVILERNTWFLTKVDMLKGHVAHIATSSHVCNDDISLQRITVEDFLNCHNRVANSSLEIK